MPVKGKNEKIIIIAIAITVAVGYLAIKYFGSGENNEPNAFAACKVLVDDCRNKDCEYYFLCNEQETKSCKVYDCGTRYGIETTDGDGNLKKETRQKFDKQKAEADVKDCTGRLAVSDAKDCLDGKATAKVKLMVSGKCEITGFMMKVDGQNKIAAYKKEGDVYAVTANQCGKISEMTAIGEGGVQIKEYY